MALTLDPPLSSCHPEPSLSEVKDLHRLTRACWGFDGYVSRRRARAFTDSLLAIGLRTKEMSRFSMEILQVASAPL